MWDFETDAEFQDLLDWADRFIADEVEPLDFVIDDPRDVHDPVRRALIPPLQQQIKDKRLWACHLEPELGGQGYGHVKMALLNEHIGRSLVAPTVFGCQPPDANTSRILARFGSDAIKQRYLQPLLAGDIYSCFAATEPAGGADPKEYTTTAYLDGDDWVLNGEKWFASYAGNCAFYMVMAVTEPDAAPYERLSLLIVPNGTPGIEILHNMQTGLVSKGSHAHLRFSDVRVQRDSMLGERGGAFVVMQARMGVARLGLATRSIGVMRRCLDMMCERAVSRSTQGEPLASKQLVQEMVTDSWIEFQQFRLLVLQTAWKLDRCTDDKHVRADIAAVKVALPKVWHNLAARAAQVHGSLGVSHELPFSDWILRALSNGVADGPTEVHKVTVARQVLRDYEPGDNVFPRYYRPTLEAAARAKYADVLALHGRA